MTDSLQPYKKYYILEFLVGAGFALAAWAGTSTFDTPLPLYEYGADGWPKTIALTMGASAAFLLMYRFLFKIRDAEALPVKNEHSVPGIRKTAIFVVPFLYTVLLPYIGFYVATAVFLPLYTRVLGERNYKRIFSVTLTVTAIIIVLFSKYLYVPFPVGSWPGFYEINAFISELMY